MSEIPRFATIGDHSFNVNQIVSVVKQGADRTLILTTADGSEGPASLNVSFDEVMKAIGGAEAPRSDDEDAYVLP